MFTKKMVDMDFSKEYDQFPYELKLLLLLLKKEICSASELKKVILFNYINWDLFIDLAEHHRVYPIIYLKLKQLEREYIIPLFVYEKLKMRYQKNIFLMLRLSCETEELAKLFANNHIHTLFLKGPVLAADLYNDISKRTSLDLDLLIPIENLEKAEEILLSNGYIKDDYIIKIHNDWKWRHHHITFFHPDKKIKVEIHWRLNPGPAKEPTFKELWSRKRIISLTKYPLYILSAEDLFLFLVTHGARHGWSRLRWLLDIHQLQKKNINWGRVVYLLQKYKYPQIGGQALILTAKLLNTKVPEEMKPFLRRKQTKLLATSALFYIKQMINLHFTPVPEEVSNYHKRYLFLSMSMQSKVLFILSWFLPYPEDIEFFPLPKRLYFLYFPLRPFLLIWRKNKKNDIRARGTDV